MTPTARTMEVLRGSGWMVCIVERFVKIPNIPGGGQRKDLFGIIDLVAIRPGHILGIQCCATSGLSSHRKKIEDDLPDMTRAWLSAGGSLQLWGWRKYKKPVAKKLWRPTVEFFTLGDGLTIVRWESDRYAD